MKTHTTLKFLIAACAALVLGAIAAPFVSAAPPLMPFAQAAADTAATVPWYLNGNVWFGLVSGLLAITTIWQNKEKAKSRKIAETLVVAIEAASKIPEVAEAEQKLKAKIQEKAVAAGVEPALNKLVKLLTP
jgi:hypothetical protein